MPRLTFIILSCFFYYTVPAQDFIGDKRQKVRKNFEKYLQDNGASNRFIETDSSLVLAFRNPQFKPVDFTFLFDSEDKCIAEIRTGCDTCVANYLQQALDKGAYQWKQTGKVQFLSNSRFRLSMEVFAEKTETTLVIRKLALNRRDYLKLLKQHKD